MVLAGFQETAQADVVFASVQSAILAWNPAFSFVCLLKQGEGNGHNLYPQVPCKGFLLSLAWLFHFSQNAKYVLLLVPAKAQISYQMFVTASSPTLTKIISELQQSRKKRATDEDPEGLVLALPLYDLAQDPIPPPLTFSKSLIP